MFMPSLVIKKKKYVSKYLLFVYKMGIILFTVYTQGISCHMFLCSLKSIWYITCPDIFL